MSGGQATSNGGRDTAWDWNISVRPLWILIFLALSLFFIKKSGTGLMSYDDAYYAEKAREMVVLNDYLTVHYNYKPSFDNPPLFFWLEAAAYKIFGINEYSACLPSGVLGVVCLILLFSFVQREWSAPVAFIATLMLLTTPHFLKWSRHAMLDVSLTCYTTLALISFYWAPIRNRKLYLLWGLGIALGILTKSVLGTFAIWIGFAYLVLSGQWREFLSPWLWLGLVVAFVVGLSWHYSQYQIHGEAFFDEHFRGLIGGKITTADEKHDLIYHLKYFLFPFQYIPHWSLFMALGFGLTAAQVFKKSRLNLFVILWFLVVAAILSLPENKKTWYLMPAFPALAILGAVGADFLVRRWSRNTAQFYRRVIYAVGVLTIGFNVVAIATPLQLSKQRETDQREFSPYVKVLGDSGFKLQHYKADFHSLNNASLFYSGYAFALGLGELATFREAVTQQSPVAVMISKGYWNEVEPEVRALNLIIVKEGDNYVLVTNRPADFSKIQFLKSRVLQ